MNIHFAAASPLQSADPWPDYDAAQQRITGTDDGVAHYMLFFKTHHMLPYLTAPITCTRPELHDST